MPLPLTFAFAARNQRDSGETAFSLLGLCAFFSLLVGSAVAGERNEWIEDVPRAYDGALRNPLKGFTTRGVGSDHPWATLAHDYLRWNELENVESDSIQKIRDVCDRRWAGIAERNVKVIPRVILRWSGDDEVYWPADLTTGDFSSKEFERRLLRLIKRLGEVWDDDPRVAFVELGIFGKWGEHHSPSPTKEMQRVAGEAFARAFPNKKVSVRHAWDEFPSQPFGEYWDSFAHLDQMREHGANIAALNRSDHRYLSNYIGGEVAYDWGNSMVQPGADPTASVSLKRHRDFVINTIRWTHCTQLRWISDYDSKDDTATRGAELIQQTLGYRFVPTRVAFRPSITDGKLSVSVSIRNEGSAPFYYNWPVEVALLTLADRKLVWSDTFDDVDIRRWQPGEAWTEPTFRAKASIATSEWVTWPTDGNEWRIAPKQHEFSQSFQVDVPPGEYLVTIAILDPAGKQPSLRLATSQYIRGGRHPIGIVANQSGQGRKLDRSISFDDPSQDDTLHYDR
ncbi:MAG: DUF4832 domain-containing protein [Planctomycetota bacterium]